MNRTKILASSLLAASLSLAVHAAGNPVRPDDLATRVSRAQAGRALTLPSQAAPVAIVSAYLRANGHSDATLRSLKLQSQSRGLRNNQLHLRMTQEVRGLQVYDTYVKATVNHRGELVSVIENLVRTPASAIARATIDEAVALTAALRILKIPGTAPGVVGRSANVTTFDKGRVFLSRPAVTRVAIPMSDGTMSAGFLVETWQRAGNRLHETLINGDGGVMEVMSRTNSDSYHVFAIDPSKSTQATVSGAPDWLFPGTHRSIDMAGNNAHAYLDAINDSVPDTGGDDITDGNFLSVFDPGIQPSAGDNREVAVQNLFFLNNVIHDTLYAHGFDEAAGNFQEDNGGLGGRASDSVNAEAQDGGGTDNANFATPRDGQNPRMQMYLWSSPDPDHEVLVNAPAELAGSLYGARRAAFGGVLNATGLSDDVTLVSDGTGVSNTDACEPITNTITGTIALLDRGACDFVVKVRNAQNAGAVGVIVTNNQGDDPIVMGGTDATITIPAVMIGQSNGTILKAAVGVNATLRLVDPAPIMQDGDLDSDIVWHEYGHGLTWRMIGRMNGPLSGAIGEGMSDVLAIIINNDDVVAEYSAGDAGGIRSEDYTNYSRTYADIAGTGVHFDGEVYGAIGWRLWENFQTAGVPDTRNTLMDYLIDGMNFTRAHPSFEDMRDGILTSVTDAAHECLVWDAFADHGVGVGAKGAARGPNVVITESFAKPAECP